MFCMYCGAKRHGEDAFCGSYGNKIVAATSGDTVESKAITNKETSNYEKS